MFHPVRQVAAGLRLRPILLLLTLTYEQGFLFGSLCILTGRKNLANRTGGRAVHFGHAQTDFIARASSEVHAISSRF